MICPEPSFGDGSVLRKDQVQKVCPIRNLSILTGKLLSITKISDLKTCLFHLDLMFLEIEMTGL